MELGQEGGDGPRKRSKPKLMERRARKRRHILSCPSRSQYILQFIIFSVALR